MVEPVSSVTWPLDQVGCSLSGQKNWSGQIWTNIVDPVVQSETCPIFQLTQFFKPITCSQLLLYHQPKNKSIFGNIYIYRPPNQLIPFYFLPLQVELILLPFSQHHLASLTKSLTLEVIVNPRLFSKVSGY